MTHAPNELAEIFPEAAHRMHDLKAQDAHFARLSEEYHALNRSIHRAETDIEPTDDLRLEAMKKTRLSLLDAIALLLREPAPSGHAL